MIDFDQVFEKAIRTFRECIEYNEYCGVRVEIEVIFRAFCGLRQIAKELQDGTQR